MSVTRTSTREDEKTFLLTLQGEQFPVAAMKSLLKGWQMVVTAFSTMDGEDYTQTADYLDVPIWFSDEDDELTLRFRGTETMVNFFMQQLGQVGLKAE
ncbi:MAG: hypothetical protein NZT92_16315 [Abditibacteriales bacterium]|nr:hypothetical protein [Abditibacteriales bacterium]MDW8367261.1 hypothetical protein [Abditibacteriales bacterium]